MPRTNGESFLVAAKCILECANAFPMTGASSCIALSVQFRVRAGIRRSSKPSPLPPCSLASVKIPSFSATSSVPPECRLGHFTRGELIEPLEDRVS